MKKELIKLYMIFFHKPKLNAKQMNKFQLNLWKKRLSFLLNIGLGYLTLDRSVATLAGGELQRIRLAAQIGLGLTGVLYVLDEPSIGLHPKDNDKLLSALEKLRDLNNSVLVVEHDEETIRRADHVIDLGPGAGSKGGHIVAEGALEDILKNPSSLTGQYLSGALSIKVPEKRKNYLSAPKLQLTGCREHNLKQIDVSFPFGCFICVTGMSGSGKSTLMHDILYKELHNRIWKTQYRVGAFDSIKSTEKIDRIIEIDQTPIGRTPRSNPATYTDIFGLESSPAADAMFTISMGIRKGDILLGPFSGPRSMYRLCSFSIV